MGYFTEITREGSVTLCHVDIWKTYNTKKEITHSRCTVRWLGNILHPWYVIICHSKFGLALPCMKAGCALIRWYKFVFQPKNVLYNDPLCCLCGRRCRQGPVSSCLRQLGEDQTPGRSRVRLFLTAFQCFFYSPARHGHPHPVPTTH